MVALLLILIAVALYAVVSAVGVLAGAVRHAARRWRGARHAR
jgi:hypothetical protein